MCVVIQTPQILDRVRGAVCILRLFVHRASLQQNNEIVLFRMEWNKTQVNATSTAFQHRMSQCRTRVQPDPCEQKNISFSTLF